MPRKTVRDGMSGAALDCGNDYFNGVVREMCEWDGWTSPRTKAQVLGSSKFLVENAHDRAFGRHTKARRLADRLRR